MNRRRGVPSMYPRELHLLSTPRAHLVCILSPQRSPTLRPAPRLWLLTAISAGRSLTVNRPTVLRHLYRLPRHRRALHAPLPV
jgi:hypothetical protein